MSNLLDIEKNVEPQYLLSGGTCKEKRQGKVTVQLRRCLYLLVQITRKGNFCKEAKTCPFEKFPGSSSSVAAYS